MIPTDGRSATLPGAPVFDQERHRAEALMSLHQVRWFIRLRWAFVAVAVGVLALERFVTPSAVRPATLVVPILLLAIINLVWMGAEDILLKRFRQPAGSEAKVNRHAQLFANLQVGVDLFLLTVILRYTGGVENPMALFYVFHMGIGALLLKPWQAIAQGCWAMVLYASLSVGECAGWITPHWGFLPQFPSPGLYTRGEFVAAALAVMACGVFATLYFTLHITSRLFQRERQLRDACVTLRRSETAIFDLQQRRSRFLQTAAHQLKAPLATIETLIGILAEGLAPPEAAAKTYGRIRQRCREGIQQVGELLTLARVQRGDPRRHRRSVADVREAVAEVYQLYAPQAESKGIQLVCRPSGTGRSPALVDPSDLTDCLGNLVDNAIKYTQGTGKVTIATAVTAASDPMFAPLAQGAPNGDSVSVLLTRSELKESKQYVTVSVTDTGMGIDPQVLAEARDPAAAGSIFDAFRRGNNALSAGIPGTGLGLAIVREVVEQAGGRILVQSRIGQGSTFTVIFPMSERDRDDLTIRETRESLLVLDAPGENRIAPASATSTTAAPATLQTRIGNIKSDKRN